jgi:hypothetical protein
MVKYNYILNFNQTSNIFNIVLKRKIENELSCIELFKATLFDNSLTKEMLVYDNDEFANIIKTIDIIKGNDTYLLLSIKSLLTIKVFDDKFIFTQIDPKYIIPIDLNINSSKNVKINTLKINNLSINATNTFILDELIASQLLIKGNLFNTGIIKISNIIFNNSHVLRNTGKVYTDKFTGSNIHIINAKGNLMVIKFMDLMETILNNDGTLITTEMIFPTGKFTNNGIWNHQGKFKADSLKFQNYNLVEWENVQWEFIRNPRNSYDNHKTWILDNVKSSDGVFIQSRGVIHFKNSVLNFSWLVGRNCIFISGQYCVDALQNWDLFSFIDNEWTITDDPNHNSGNYLYADIKGYGPPGKFESEKTLYYNIEKLPDLITGCQDIYLSNKYKTRTSIDLDKIKCSGKVHLNLQTLNILNDLEITNINHLALTVNTSVNINKTFKALSLSLNINGALTLGTSNTEMGTITTTKGSLTITAHKVDNRFGKIYGKGPTQIMALKGDILIGSAFNKGPFVYGLNGSYIASGNNLFIFSSQELKNQYGQIFSQGTLNLNAQIKISNIAGEILCGDNIHIDTREFHNTRDGTYTQNIRKWTYAYSGCYNHCELSDQSFLRALGNIYFNVATGNNMASTIIAQNNIYYNTKKIFFLQKYDYKKEKPTTFTSTGRDNYGYGCNDKVGYQRGCSPVSSYPATIKAGESIQINTGTFAISGNMNSPIISINANVGTLHNTTRTRETINPTETLFIDITQFIQSLITNGGFLQLNNKGEIQTEFDSGLPYINNSNMDLMNQHTNRLNNGQLNNIFNPLAKLSATMFDLFIQSALSQMAGKVNLKDGKGIALGKKLWDNAIKFQQLTNKNNISREDIQKASHAMLIKEIHEINNRFEQKTVLCLPSSEINPYQSDGDISADEFKYKTDGDQIHLNTRIVAKDLLEVISKNGSIIRKTESYVQITDTDKFIIEDISMPTQTMVCLNGDVNITAHKNILTVGTYTEGNNINETAKTGNITTKPLILQKVVSTKHEEDDGLVSTKTITDTQTTYSAVQSINIAKSKIHKTSEKLINQIATYDIAGKEIIYEADDLTISSLIKADKTEHQEETNGAFTNTSLSVSQETPKAFNAYINAPKVQIKSNKAILKGVAVNGDIIEDYTDEGLNFEPVVAEMHYSKQMIVESPLASADIGCKGGYEVMVPCRLTVNKIIRMINSGQIKLNSVEWNKDKTKLIGKFVETTYILKQWHTEWNISKQAIPTGALVIVSLAISYFTMDLGATLTGLNGTLGVVASAGFTTLCNVAAMSFLQTGDPIAVVKGIFSNNFLKTLAINVASAGLVSSIGSSFNINMNPALTNAKFTEFLKLNALQAGVNIPLRIVIGKESMHQVVRNEVIKCFINSMAMKMASVIGQRYRTNKLNFVNQKLYHGISGGIIGGLVAMVEHKPIKSGVISGALGAIIGETMAELNPFEIGDIQGNLTTAKMVAGTIAMMFKQDVNIAIKTGDITIENNHFPCIMAALTALGITHTVKDVIDVYEEEGINKAIDTIVIGWIAMKLEHVITHYGGKAIKYGKNVWTKLMNPKIPLDPKSPLAKELLHTKLSIHEKMIEPGHLIAGNGTNRPLWDAERILKIHGGNINDWSVKSSTEIMTLSGERLQLHWLENIKLQQRVEYKIKIIK